MHGTSLQEALLLQHRALARPRMRTRHWLSPEALPFLELTAEKHLEAGFFLG